MTTPTPLSPFHFRQTMSTLQCFDKQSALRQIEVHRQRGDFTDRDLSLMTDLISRGRYVDLYDF